MRRNVALVSFFLGPLLAFIAIHRNVCCFIGETHHSTTEGKTQHLIGRGRGLALLTQQRRPGEKRDQPQEPLGRGRGSVMRKNVSEPSALNNGMSALRSALDESVYDNDEGL